MYNYRASVHESSRSAAVDLSRARWPTATMVTTVLHSHLRDCRDVNPISDSPVPNMLGPRYYPLMHLAPSLSPTVEGFARVRMNFYCRLSTTELMRLYSSRHSGMCFPNTYGHLSMAFPSATSDYESDGQPGHRPLGVSGTAEIKSTHADSGGK